ncbi:reverse transcriptase [Plakobranchus ocellatus]|uniref:Reverse transcriptase n=1 Tax=Plakobranchus ocellatus TaxID=259542 RepID=A0AAV3ZI06_9GAST|nr:reverse transcriptase [Plakobranchus ocellatus]
MPLYIPPSPAPAEKLQGHPPSSPPPYPLAPNVHVTEGEHWITGDIPPSWREASVVPISKPDKDLFDPSNYRPIALTSCLCNILEWMVNDRLVHVLESRNLLSKIQENP